MEKVILFDFFGVISSEVSPIFFKRYFNEEEAKRVKEEIMSKGDKGELSEEEIYDYDEESYDDDENDYGVESQDDIDDFNDFLMGLLGEDSEDESNEE